MSRLTAVLRHPAVYIAMQRAVGADRLRYHCLERLELAPGDTVVDVGCGPAYYLGRLPQRVSYFGYDTEPRYVRWARKRWGDRASFHLGQFDEQQLSRLPPVDAVLLLGVLHHLSDAESTELLRLAGRALDPIGRVVAVDPCFEPTQGRISRWMSDHDRGEHVRAPDAFVDLGRRRFESVDGEVLSNVTRVPSSHWMMWMSRPRP